MRFPLIIIVALLALILMHRIKYTKKQGDANRERFWKREREANASRKKDISDLDYLYVAIERLPFGIDQDPKVLALEDTIRRLDKAKILNLSGYSNTDIKLAYGVANLSELSECDERFTVLIRSLYQWACLLLDHGHTAEAMEIARYSVEIGSDISGVYYMLTDYYVSLQDSDALNELMKNAETIKGIQAVAIKEYISKSMS